jgi:hypothetical protein
VAGNHGRQVGGSHRLHVKAGVPAAAVDGIPHAFAAAATVAVRLLLLVVAAALVAAHCCCCCAVCCITLR